MFSYKMFYNEMKLVRNINFKKQKFIKNKERTFTIKKFL